MGIFDRVRGVIGRRNSPAVVVADAIPALPAGAYSGGLTNPLTGAGSSQDKAKGFYYTDRTWTRGQLDTIIDNSWSAAKVIEIPVDDCFNRWRSWDDTDRIEELNRYEKAMQIQKTMRDLMLTGRKYGTALGVIITKDDETSRPLDVRNIVEGDLVDVIVVDRFSATVAERYDNPFDLGEDEGARYGMPQIYDINLPFGGRMLKVHHSRILRFDGIPRPTNAMEGDDKNWGTPIIQRLIDAIIAEDSTAGAAAHLVQEASVKIMRMGDIRALQAAGKVKSFQDELQRMNVFKSIYRMFVLPHDARYERQSYTFGGIKDLMDRQMIRIAAGADIPATRFAGRSPAGLDATGESDDANYARKIAGELGRMRVLIEYFDSIAMRSYGLAFDEGNTPSFSFPSIMDQSDTAKAEAERKKAEAVRVAHQEGAIDATEMRAILSGGPVFGPLPGEAPEPPEPEPAPEPFEGPEPSSPESGEED